MNNKINRLNERSLRTVHCYRNLQIPQRSMFKHNDNAFHDNNNKLCNLRIQNNLENLYSKIAPYGIKKFIIWCHKIRSKIKNGQQIAHVVYLKGICNMLVLHKFQFCVVFFHCKVSFIYLQTILSKNFCATTFFSF